MCLLARNPGTTCINSTGATGIAGDDIDRDKILQIIFNEIKKKKQYQLLMILIRYLY